ncbi:uncharacterized protein [Argopecten irradians]|uniref:uncharacterized protein n=1 Tax=Argopecten irradians TaxID=31199 RepID=UPI00371E1A15
MIIYVESKAFPYKTFLTVVKPSDKIARIRAHLLHILYDIGREDLQFKLRYKGQYLRDAFFIEDYDIPENAVIKLLPVAKRNDTMLDIRSIASTMTMSVDTISTSGQQDVKVELFREIKEFIRREKMVRAFDGMIYLMFLTTCLSVFTNYWYAVAWTGVFLAFTVIFRPYYNRHGGFTGNYTQWRFLYCIFFVVGAVGPRLITAVKTGYLLMNVVIFIQDHGCKDWVFVDVCCNILQDHGCKDWVFVDVCCNILQDHGCKDWVFVDVCCNILQDHGCKDWVFVDVCCNILQGHGCKDWVFVDVCCNILKGHGCKDWVFVDVCCHILQDHGCKDWVFVDECSHKNVFTAVFYSAHSVILLASAILIGLLFVNFRLEKGDYIEKFLVQERDIELVMKSARSSKIKEKRTAAHELACMAASGDDNKFRIVAEGGLDVLMAMAHCDDDVTQEHAVEAIAELLTIQSIQDNFVDMNGVQTLTSLLHSENSRIMQEAADSLYTIVSESEENKSAVVADHGLDDLAHAAYQGTIYCQRTVASIYLELAFTPEIRAQMAARNIPAQALVHLCGSTDPDTQRYALQTFELLAIESSEMICAQEELMEVLLELPNKTLDEKLYLLAGKILLYYAENRMTCEMLVNHPSIRDTLGMFARSHDTILQKVVTKVIFCMLDTKEMKLKAKDQQLHRVLEYIRDNSLDREAWDMADQGIQAMDSDEDNLSTLPMLSTLEKLNKMGGEKQRFGSKTSLGSDEKPGASNSSNSD